MEKIVLVTVATDPNHKNFKLWKKSAIKAGWKNNMKVLGLNEKWGGWPWRSSLLSNYCKSLNPKHIVVVCDSYDLLVFGSPNEALQIFKNHNKDLVFGIESGCLINCKSPLMKGISLNGGCNIGYAKIFQKAYDFIGKNHDDDQIGWRDYIEKNPINYSLDIKQELVMNYQYGNMNIIGKNTNYMKDFFREWFFTYMNPDRTRKFLKIDMNDNRPTTIKNIKPVFVHCPGTGKADKYVLYKDLCMRVKIDNPEGLNLDKITFNLKLFFIIFLVVVILLFIYKTLF